MRGVRPHERTANPPQARIRGLRGPKESHRRHARHFNQKMMHIIQINLQRSATAQSLLQQTSAERGAHVLIVSEPNWLPANDDRWVCSTDGSCAVALTSAADFVPDAKGSGRGFAWLQGKGLRIYSCYNSRNDTADNYAAFLDDIHQSAMECDAQTHLLICGDFNAWSHEWGSARNDQRGDQLSDLAASLNLSTENTGTTSTYRRINAESVIDVTFSRLLAPVVLRGWRVLEEVESASDHRYIEFTIDTTRDGEGNDVNPSRGWSVRQLDPPALASHLANTAQPNFNDSTTASQAADQLIEYLASACDSCMPPRVSPRAGRRQVHWWSKDLAALRQTTIKLRRALQRAARRHGHPDFTDAPRAAYTAKRKELRNAIRDAQAKSWSDLCAAVDSDPWGLPYRVVTKRIGRRRPGAEARGREMEIVDRLFPNLPPTDWTLSPLPNDNDDNDYRLPPEFTPVELAEACRRLPSGKATGPDGIPNELLKKVFNFRPRALLDAFNACLTNNTFPVRWKQARLVLLHKGPGKPLADPSSYRPLCMLDSSGKLLERLLLSRLDDHLDRTGRRSPNQYGFRRGRSTEDAIGRLLEAAQGAAIGAVQHRDICVAISLDVRNAFNTAPWSLIDSALRDKRVPRYLIGMIRSYLQDRSIQVGDNLLRRNMTCGVPQGSVLGPALWNIFYDRLLELEMPPMVQLVAFADDVCVLGIARTGQAATALLNPALDIVSAWIRHNGLHLAPQKSEAVVLTTKNKFTNPELLVDGHAIPVGRSMKYLGVEVDTRLLFTRHVEQASRRATEAALAIGRLMPNIGGPSQAKRALLASVVNSKMLYASPVWAARATKTAKNRAELARAQRRIALRIIRSYRTVSACASSLLSELAPADLLANERARIRLRLDDTNEDTSTPEIKKQEKAITTAAWQARWDRSPNGRWTHRLIPDVGRWLSKPSLNLTFHLTQALTGHGCFRGYLQRMNRAVDSYCFYCMDPEDTVEHTLFVCPRWEDDRARMTEILRRPPAPEDIEEILCGPRRELLPDDPAVRTRLLTQALATRLELIAMIESILSVKEEDEREDQANA